MGMADEDVAILKALMAEERIEVVARLANDIIPELREKTSLIESPKRDDPMISKLPAVLVAIPMPRPPDTVALLVTVKPPPVTERPLAEVMPDLKVEVEVMVNSSTDVSPRNMLPIPPKLVRVVDPVT
jgi:hypothetical protein